MCFQEALSQEQHNVTTSIKASPSLVRAGKEQAEGGGARTNRFGFKAPFKVSGRPGSAKGGANHGSKCRSHPGSQLLSAALSRLASSPLATS